MLRKSNIKSLSELFSKNNYTINNFKFAKTKLLFLGQAVRKQRRV